MFRITAPPSLIKRWTATPDGRPDLSPFDTTLAFELYEKLFKPAEELLQGVRHLFVVPTGPLQSLPLGVLVTNKSKKPSNFADYRGFPWLAKRYAITSLPSVSSLKALTCPHEVVHLL
mgnify:CR=1